MSQNKHVDENEEILKRHLEASIIGNKKDEQVIHVESSKVSDLEFFSYDISFLPSSLFYPSGAALQIRASSVKEIQAYSMVDDTNYYDITEKMNYMLMSCVRIKYPNGVVGSYLELRDPDRYFVIFLIRELTFQNGSSLSTTVDCACGNPVQIELVHQNFRTFELNKRIAKFYDKNNRCFRFETKKGGIYYMSPPTIGVNKSLTEYIIKKNANKETLNMSFLKIVPFLFYNKISVTEEEILAKEAEFKTMDIQEFQFINAAVDLITFGIEKLEKKCEVCGNEVRTDMVFPTGASGIFIDDDAFGRFIKE